MDWRRPTPKERDEIILSVLNEIETVVPTGDRKHWEKVWQKVGDDWRHSKDRADLIPPFFNRSPLRIDGDYAIPDRDFFDYEWYCDFRDGLFHKWMADVGTVIEFGAGSCFNLVALREMFPRKYYIAIDSAESSCRLALELGGFNPVCVDIKTTSTCADGGLKAGVFTVGALEQTGTKWTRFMYDRLKAKPSVCLHIEPIIEWYDPKNLLDELAIRYHRKRGYWEGFWPWLQEHEALGHLRILDWGRPNFGSTFIEYMYVVWKPL